MTTLAVLAIGGALILLIVLVLLLRSRPPPPAGTSAEDRADVLARLHRHTQERAPAEPDPTGDDAPAAGAPSAAAELFRAGVREHDRRAGPRFDVRLPSLMLLNLAPGADARHVETAPPLGARGDVIARLREILPDFEPGPDGRARHTGSDHDLTIDIGAHDVVHTVVIEAAGETGVSMVGWLLDATGWRAFVPKAGRFVEADRLEELLT